MKSNFFKYVFIIFVIVIIVAVIYKINQKEEIINEEPETLQSEEEIVKEIEAGIKKTKWNYSVIVDRKEAIKEAINMLHKNDILILAGKGHETYQEINGEKYSFDERIIIKEILEEKKK